MARHAHVCPLCLFSKICYKPNCGIPAKVICGPCEHEMMYGQKPASEIGKHGEEA